ncbi:MAG: hypothetical protein MUF25_11995 [Pirellulaceae bacterium]|nr:hypothetical protein [Pirellulaceae bacterium]
MRRTTCVIAALTMALLTMGDIATAVEATLWKAGVAKVKITPQGPYFAAGYGGEKRIATEKHHDLWIKVLALEDAQGQRGLLITSDICGFDRVSYDAICTGLKQRCGLDRAQIILNSTHNHSGPVTRNSLMPFHDFTPDDLHRIGVYTREIEQKAIDAAAEAFGCLVPATLSLGAGQVDFAVNRRNNRDADIPKRLPHRAPLRGPVDHRVPVIAVRSPAGGLLAVVFAYACHPVMTAESVWSGDFPGFAMLDLEQAHPKVMALFCQGCGGDQNCIRGPLALAREQGRLLATAVEQALAKPMTRIEPRLATTGVTILLDYERVVTGQELEAVLLAEDPGTSAKARWARQVLAELKDRGRLPTGYSYPMQAWKLGTKTLWVALSGEPLVDYALTLQKQFGPETLVTGCCSDLMAYIPTRRIWEEACGEEVMYLWEYGRPAYRWAGDVEPRILAAVEQMARTLEDQTGGRESSVER